MLGMDPGQVVNSGRQRGIAGTGEELDAPGLLRMRYIRDCSGIESCSALFTDN